MPGKFGKNNIKLVGVSKYATIVSPPAGDALYLRGASGYVLRGLTAVVAGGRGARGLVLAGGINSVLPTFPGAQVNVSLSDLMENHQANALLTGTSNAWFRYVRLNRSRAGHGLSAWGNTYVRVVCERDQQQRIHGRARRRRRPTPARDSTSATTPKATRGAARCTRTSPTASSSVVRSVVRLTSNTIDSTGVNGINVCASGITPDTSVIYMTGNWVAANGFNWPGGTGSGMEIYLTCSGTQTITGNTFIGNALNGLFVASGTANITNNVFQANTIGAHALRDQRLRRRGAELHEPDRHALRQHVRRQRARRHLLRNGIRAPRTRDVFATVGGTARGQKNSSATTRRRNSTPSAASTSTTNFKCPLGGNFFDHSGDDVEQPACNSACVSTP